mgnify:CR=1 FL=1
MGEQLDRIEALLLLQENQLVELGKKLATYDTALASHELSLALLNKQARKGLRLKYVSSGRISKGF